MLLRHGATMKWYNISDLKDLTKISKRNEDIWETISAGLVSSYLQVPTLVQSSRCYQDFSLVWGMKTAYSLLLRRTLRCSDGWARISSALSSGMCGATHLVRWDQLLSLSTFPLHTVALSLLIKCTLIRRLVLLVGLS